MVNFTLAAYPRLREVNLPAMQSNYLIAFSCFILDESVGTTDRPAYCDIRLEEQLRIGYCNTFKVVEQILHYFIAFLTLYLINLETSGSRDLLK